MKALCTRVSFPRNVFIAASTCILLAAPFAFGAQNDVSSSTRASASAAKFTLENGWVAVAGLADRGHWGGIRVEDQATHKTLQLPEAFSFKLQDGSRLSSSDMEMTQRFTIKSFAPNTIASRYAERLNGKEACTRFSDRKTALRVEWCGILRDGSNYFRQQITIQTGAEALPITEVRLLQLEDAGVHEVGQVKGSPVADDTTFFGFEHPLATNEVRSGEVVAYLTRELPIQPEQRIVYSSVIGVAQKGQLRRAFLRYIERERAHPYRTFLQYNTWYDLGYTNRYDEAGVLSRMQALGTELVRKRGVQLNSFLLDDGWDNTGSLWKMNSGFPNGFKRVREAAVSYHAAIGVWLSPWGGYSHEKEQRIAFGQQHGYEIVKAGFALSGPKYYAAFEKTCLDLIQNYGVNQFKFDGTGNVNHVFPGSQFDSDFDAAIHLIDRLRLAEPSIYINLTTGTLPSPFWLMDADSIWRGGEDHSFAGVGSSRQRWITYRDSQTYRNIVQRGPLFPLNSLMLHGMIYAQYAKGLNTDPDEDFHDEVESFFGSGTQVQEMYITPSLLSRVDWDTLAEGANWARAHAETLKDTHWIGGDPALLQVYGWASDRPADAKRSANAIIVLRNPSDKPQNYSLDIRQACELPARSPNIYRARDPWHGEASHITLRAGHSVKLQLKPWEVRTFDAESVH